MALHKLQRAASPTPAAASMGSGAQSPLRPQREQRSKALGAFFFFFPRMNEWRKTQALKGRVTAAGAIPKGPAPSAETSPTIQGNVAAAKRLTP